MSTRQYFLIVILTVFIVLSAFYSGFFLKNILLKANPIKNSEVTNQKYLPYFSDQIILISKKEPHHTLIATVSRFSTDNTTYTQYQKAFYFNGDKWFRDASDINSDNLNIAPSKTIPKWTIKDDPTLVLKQSVEGEAQINNSKITFNVPNIENEMGIRSLSNYTEFRSETDGKLIIDDKEFDSYVLYSRIYSYNGTIGTVTTNDPIGINTDWVAIWDTDGNFYNIDKTTVDGNFQGKYKFHSIAVFKDKNEKISKSFITEIQKNKDLGYKINITDKIKADITMDFLNSISKTQVNSKYDNFIGQITGDIKLSDGKTVKGFGIFEYIYQ